MFKSYSEAAAQLPADAKWSSSFGYPGEGGYSEYHRDHDGNRYVIQNGPWDAGGNEWTMKAVAHV